MEAFSKLVEVADRLNSENGCPWDIQQTFESLRPYVLEEAYELLEAMDKRDDEAILEELGDLFYTVVFYAKVAERQNRFSLEEVIEGLTQKLVRRHPHVFEENQKKKNMDEVIQTWNEIKSQEKPDRTTPLDGIPKHLPLLQKATKVLSLMKKHNCQVKEISVSDREEELAQVILNIVEEAVDQQIDIESAFRQLLHLQQTHFQLHASSTIG